MTTPTLVLGLGGFGTSVIIEVKKLLGELAPAARVPTALLAIDQKEVIEDPANQLGAEERLALRPRKASEILEHLGVSGGERSGWRDLLDWFPDGDSLQLIDALEPCGARRYRPLGRLGLFAADEVVERAIRKGIFRARCASPAPDPEASIRVVLVTSLGGGSGSGMLLDVAHLARRLDGTALLLGYLALPGAFLDYDFSNRLKANTYAALEEIAALRTGGIEFEAHFERIPAIHPLVSRRELFARTFLFGEVERCDVLGNVIRRTARSIVAQLDVRVQRATICVVQGMARLVDAERRRELAPAAFGTAAARWLLSGDFSALEPVEPDAASADGRLLEQSRTASDVTSPAGEVDLKSPSTEAGTQAVATANPTDERRWRLTIWHEIEELGTAIRSELQKRLESLASHLRDIWLATGRDEHELGGLENLIVISGMGDAQKWSVDPEALATHELFRALGAKERLRKANEDFRTLQTETEPPTGSPPVQPGSDSEAMMRLLSHWEALRNAARQPSLWARFRRAAILGRRGTRPLEERCIAFHEIVDRPEFRERLLGALESYASALRDQERGASSAQVSAAEAASGSGVASGSEAEGSKAVPGHEISKVTARVAHWEGHLLQVVRDLRESVFGDPEPRPRRRAFLLALVPEDFPWPTGFVGLKNALESAAAELEARCLVERYSGDRLWLVAEDLFNSADHVRLLEGYREAYEHGEPKELYHLDWRWVDKLGEQKRPTSNL